MITFRDCELGVHQQLKVDTRLKSHWDWLGRNCSLYALASTDNFSQSQLGNLLLVLHWYKHRISDIPPCSSSMTTWIPQQFSSYLILPPSCNNLKTLSKKSEKKIEASSPSNPWKPKRKIQFKKYYRLIRRLPSSILSSSIKLHGHKWRQCKCLSLLEPTKFRIISRARLIAKSWD